MNDENAASPRRGVVAVVQREGRLLVIRRSAAVVAPLAYCFPGGGIEAGESEEAALVRELAEELHAQVRPLKLIWRSTTPWGVELAWWLADLLSEVRANPAEVDAWQWSTPEEMSRLPNLLESNREFLAKLAQGAIALEPDAPEPGALEPARPVSSVPPQSAR
ncbi:MAG TPA: NUDIX domain-containing protein [Pirellulales bacterium]|nr:NUDIX domain-containing protein [Pirellulales bacterium]